jgi:hypothetical protein
MVKEGKAARDLIRHIVRHLACKSNIRTVRVLAGLSIYAPPRRNVRLNIGCGAEAGCVARDTMGEGPENDRPNLHTVLIFHVLYGILL